jgi:hypothetical protein
LIATFAAEEALAECPTETIGNDGAENTRPGRDRARKRDAGIPPLRLWEFRFTKAPDFARVAMKNLPTSSFRLPLFRHPFSEGKKLAVLLVAALGWLGLTSAPAGTGSPDSARVLIFGNSFSGNSTKHLAALSKEGGKKLYLLDLFKSGCSLEEHAAAIKAADTDPESPQARFYIPRGNAREKFAPKKKINAMEAIQAGPWDYVSIQQYSVKSHRAESFEPYAGEVIDFIRTNAPEAKILVHETWAYRHDDVIYKDGKLTPEKMHEALRNNYLSLAKNYGLLFLPIGDAFHAASQTPEWTYVKDKTFDYKNPKEGDVPKQPGSLHAGWIWLRIPRVTADGQSDPSDKEAPLKFLLDAHHANAAGEYLGSCVWYEFLFNDDVTKLTNYQPAGLTPEQAASLRKIAHDTVEAQRRSDANLLP